MLTTKVITPRQGESYYAKENYYSAEESVEHSQWAGVGAEELGLKGKVKPKDFKKLLYGELPGGDPFRTKKKERLGYKERAGLDCTFSAPKSVSILALVAGDKRLEEAHREAVLRTLAIIEQDYAMTRVTRQGEVQVVNTGNLVVGQFHHDTSRELDPHLHTHCVLLNMTKHDGRWYSLRNDDIHANKKLLGMIYQNDLALQVKKLGYEIEPKEHGQFEVKGFTTEQLESFSKRRQQIKAQPGEESTWKQRELIWDKTRLAKGEPIPRAELQDYWKKELESLEVAYPQPSQENPAQPKLIVEEAVAEAIEHCSERTVAFKPEAIQKFILNEVGNYRQQDLEQAIATDNELIHLDGRVTTQTALMRELATIRLMKEGKGQVSAITKSPSTEGIASPEAVQNYTAERDLTEGQQNAVTLAATSEDQFVAWQGKAGAGKTHALNEFKKIAQEQGYAVKGFAPSAKAAKVLKKELGIETTTVARHLVSKPLQKEVQPPSIWIVDEAGLLGAKNALALLQKATEERARVLLVGDTRQLSSVEAGNPFKSLQQAGMTTAHLNQSLRQKTHDLKQAVELLSEEQTAQGIEILDASGRIKEIQNVEDRAKRIAQDYLQLSPTEREQTLIIAGTHREREAILHSVREGLKQEGSLGEAGTVERLQSKNLTNVQKKYAHYYQQGDVVIPLANYKRLGLEKGKPYRVESAAKDRLTLTNEAGTQYRVDPAWFKHKEVYQALETEIAVGDRLRWGKNDKELNRTNGEEFVVTQINNDTARIRTESGTEEQIDLIAPQHLAHNLVNTTYSSQGATANRVLVSATNDRTLSQESFYVAASRAKYNLQLYVENRAKLVEKASESQAQLNPVELLREQRKQEVAAEPLVGISFSGSQSSVSKPPPKVKSPSHERNQTAPSDLQRDSERSPESRGQPIRATVNKPLKWAAQAGELAQGINRFIERREIQSLSPAFVRLEQQLKNYQFSTTAKLQQLASSINYLEKWTQSQAQEVKTITRTGLPPLQSKPETKINVAQKHFNPRDAQRNQAQLQAVTPREPSRSPLFDPLPDETKWSAVEDYLVNKRGLPENLVDQLHKRGKVYADSQQNAVFLRQNLEKEPTGVSLKRTDKDSQFKELTTGTQPNQGWFSVTKGEGELKRIVLTESLIDTLSAAAIAQKPEKTMFLSTDESGSVPTQWLKEQSHRGVQILAAHNRDRAGEYFAWSVAKDLPEVERVTPKAKNWNDQLLKGEHPPKPEPQVWKRVAIALGKSSVYVARIEEVTANITALSPLSQEARQEMHSDFRAYQKITDNLWQWHRAAREQERSKGYIKRISEVALKFHAPNNPTSLSEVATRTMHYDLFDQELRAQYLDLKAQVQKNSKLQKASPETIDTAVASLVIQKNLRVVQDRGKTFEQVSNVLSQSERVRGWRKSLPEGEYLERAKQYVIQIYGQANELSNGVSKQQKERGSALEL